MPISHGNNKPYETEIEEGFYYDDFASKNSSKIVKEWMNKLLKNSMFGNVDIDADSFFSDDDLWSTRVSNKKTYQGSEWIL
jgi:hypothetical protein